MTTNTQITKVEYRLMDFALRQPFRFATAELTYLPYAWIKLTTADGTVGFGEAPTYWDPTGETQLAAIGAFKLWEPLLIGQDALAVRDICRLIEQASRGAYAARCSVETAILDIAAKSMNVPAAVVLGTTARPVYVNGVIGLPAGAADNRFDAAAAKIAAGMRTIKLKSSDESFEQDVRLVQKLISQYGPDITVFVDANQSWGDACEALGRVRRMAQAGAAWVEQPIAAGDMRGQQYVCQNSPLPIMLDEAVTDDLSLARACQAGAVNYANLKLAKAGGPFSAMKFAAVAEANGIAYSIGSMVESGLGMLANYCVAQACLPLTCDLDAYSLVDDGLDVGFVRDGAALTRRDDTLPGLGYDLAQMERVFQQGKTVLIK